MYIPFCNSSSSFSLTTRASRSHITDPLNSNCPLLASTDYVPVLQYSCNFGGSLLKTSRVTESTALGGRMHFLILSCPCLLSVSLFFFFCRCLLSVSPFFFFCRCLISVFLSTHFPLCMSLSRRLPFMRALILLYYHPLLAS